jgi:hypothetical protein
LAMFLTLYLLFSTIGGAPILCNMKDQKPMMPMMPPLYKVNIYLVLVGMSMGSSFEFLQSVNFC